MGIHSVTTGSNMETRHGNWAQCPSTFDANKQSKSPSPHHFHFLFLSQNKISLSLHGLTLSNILKVHEQVLPVFMSQLNH